MVAHSEVKSNQFDLSSPRSPAPPRDTLSPSVGRLRPIGRACCRGLPRVAGELIRCLVGAKSAAVYQRTLASK